MTLQDFANYTVEVRKAVEGQYRGKTVYTTHPPTSGIVLLHILNLLERYDLPAEGLNPLNLHRVIEALKCMCLPSARGSRLTSNLSWLLGADTAWRPGLHRQPYPYSRDTHKGVCRLHRPSHRG